MKKIALLMLLAIGLTECKNPDKEIEISWTNSGIVTYHYGSSPGWSWRRKFEVTSEQSGEMTVAVSCNDDELTCTEFVESGVRYSLSVGGTSSSFRTLYPISVSSPVFESFSIGSGRSITGIGINESN